MCIRACSAALALLRVFLPLAVEVGDDVSDVVEVPDALRVAVQEEELLDVLTDVSAFETRMSMLNI